MIDKITPMRKAIVVSIAGLICMAAMLGVAKNCIDHWAASTLIRGVLRVVALLAWGLITYKVITLKYKWLRKLAGING